MTLPIPTGSSFKVEKKVEIWKEDFEWFQRTHNKASISWFTNIALHAYRTVCENPALIKDLDVITPAALADVAMAILKEEISEGIHGDKREKTEEV